MSFKCHWGKLQTLNLTPNCVTLMGKVDKFVHEIWRQYSGLVCPSKATITFQLQFPTSLGLFTLSWMEREATLPFHILVITLHEVKHSYVRPIGFHREICRIIQLIISCPSNVNSLWRKLAPWDFRDVSINRQINYIQLYTKLDMKENLFHCEGWHWLKKMGVILSETLTHVCFINSTSTNASV